MGDIKKSICPRLDVSNAISMVADFSQLKSKIMVNL